MQQGSLFDDIPEARFWDSVIDGARKAAKKRLPYQLEGESKEEYDLNLRDEIRLEFAYRLHLIATDIEQKTLERQNKAIECLYKNLEWLK